jgi:hypothetical protein
VISPSAGETINPSPCGVTRTGSRKNAATQSVMPAIGHASVSHAMKARNAVIAPEIRMYLRPSGWTLGQRHLTPVVIAVLSGCMISFIPPL